MMGWNGNRRPPGLEPRPARIHLFATLAVLGGLGTLALLGALGALAFSQAADRRDHDLRASDSKRSGGEDFHWSWRIPAGQEIEIKGVNGGIHATGAGGSEVEVRAYKSARRSNPEDVKIEIVKHEDGVTVCAVYPNPSGRPNTCEPGEGGHSHVDNNDVVVDFEVRVPKGVRFVGRTVNGGIEAEGLEGPVEARTVNGSIQISTGSYAKAVTVNGSIAATMRDASWRNELEFRTVNGAITLEFPEPLDADIQAKTLNGEISTDFPLTVRGRFSRHKLSGTVGRGGRDLNLQTVNGDIRLRSIQ